jgi:hypothetical protein
MTLKAISKEENIRLCNEFSWHSIGENKLGNEGSGGNVCSINFVQTVS